MKPVRKLFKLTQFVYCVITLVLLGSNMVLAFTNRTTDVTTLALVIVVVSWCVQRILQEGLDVVDEFVSNVFKSLKNGE